MGTCAGVSVGVGGDVGGGGGGGVRGCVRVPVHSHAQTLPCEPPAHTTGLGILA